MAPRPSTSGPDRTRIGPAYLCMFLLFVLLTQACGMQTSGLAASAAEPAPIQPNWTRTPFLPQPETPTSPPASPTSPPTLTPTLAPDAWRDLPVVPVVSDRAREIYERGLALGNDPNAFSVIGDCEGTPPRFLASFDYSPTWYRLGEYAYLQGVIDHFTGSFGRVSYAASDGFTSSSVLSPMWAHPDYCQSGETPLVCEIRIHRPSIAFVVIGTDEYHHRELYEGQMRRILDYLIEGGVVPILYTKATNLEGDWSINAAAARLAYEYDLPIWNFWRAVQPLPAHGLDPDGTHISSGYNLFDNPEAMSNGWPWRNLTALQALDAVWRVVTGLAPAGGNPLHGAG